MLLPRVRVRVRVRVPAAGHYSGMGGASPGGPGSHGMGDGGKSPGHGGGSMEDMAMGGGMARPARPALLSLSLASALNRRRCRAQCLYRGRRGELKMCDEARGRHWVLK